MKEYKYALIIDGVPYLLTDTPRIGSSGDRTHITSKPEFGADLSPTASWILIPYADWLSAQYRVPYTQQGSEECQT